MANPFLGLAAHTTLGFRAQLVTARLSARVLRVARHQIKYPEGFNATVTRKDGLGGCAGNAGTALRWRAPGPSSCRRLLWRRCRRLPHLVYIPRTHFGLRRSDEHLPASVQGDCEVLYSVVASIPQNGSEKFPSHHCRFRRSLSELPPPQLLDFHGGGPLTVVSFKRVVTVGAVYSLGPGVAAVRGRYGVAGREHPQMGEGRVPRGGV
jgi:hypothetical protein